MKPQDTIVLCNLYVSCDNHDPMYRPNILTFLFRFVYSNYSNRNRTEEKYIVSKDNLDGKRERERERESEFQWIIAIDEFPRISRQVRFMEVEETRNYRPFRASIVENSLLCQNFRNENEIFARSQCHVYHTRQRGFSIATIIDRTQSHYDAGHSWVIDQPSVLTTT